jgi:alanine dehydrogenase
MGADTVVADRSRAALLRLAAEHGWRLQTVLAGPAVIAAEAALADAVIGAALVPGALAPKLVTRPMLASMKRGAVMVDVSIDQGGCFETSRPTTHADPVYEVDGIVHYCVANMPGAVPRTSTCALNAATLPFVQALADRGIARALVEDEHLRNGLNVCRGSVTRREVAQALGCAAVDPLAALGG